MTARPRYNMASSRRGVEEAEHAEHRRPSSVNRKSQEADNKGLVQYWQTTIPTVKERISFLFNNEILSDVQFIVGKDGIKETIPAHKFILSIGSAVFNVMFNGALATTDDQVEIPDVGPATFLNLLKFLYTDEVKIDGETVLTTLYAAKKYAVIPLETICVDFLKGNLAVDNAFLILTQARLFDEPELADLCLEIIDKNTSEALDSEGFVDIDHDTLYTVLERDTLCVSELKIFEAVLRWAEAECGRRELPVTSMNQRRVLGRNLDAIRFSLMSVEEFSLGPAMSGILDDQKTFHLFVYFTANPQPSVISEEFTVSRFTKIDSRWGYSGTPDKIQFKVNKRIYVTGFELYASCSCPYDYKVNIQIIHKSSSEICGSNDIMYHCDGSDITFRAMFDVPIEIQPYSTYIALANIKGSDTFYGTKGMGRVTVNCNNGQRVIFLFSLASGINNGTSTKDGQIPAIIFNM